MPCVKVTGRKKMSSGLGKRKNDWPHVVTSSWVFVVAPANCRPDVPSVTQLSYPHVLTPFFAIEWWSSSGRWSSLGSPTVFNWISSLYCSRTAGLFWEHRFKRKISYCGARSYLAIVEPHAMLAKINKYVSICDAHMVHSRWFQRCARRMAVLVAVVQLEVATEVSGSHAEKAFHLGWSHAISPIHSEGVNVFALLDSLSTQRLRFSFAQTPYSLDLDLA